MFGLLSASLSTTGWTRFDGRRERIELNHPFCMKRAFITSVFRTYAPGIKTNERIMSKNPRMIMMFTSLFTIKQTRNRSPVINSNSHVTKLIWMFTVRVFFRVLFASPLSNCCTPLAWSCLKISKNIIE